MQRWQNYEIDCTDYLNSKFGDYAYFNHQGGADSTVPDILVKTNSGKSFYVEVKECPAQCGQFVLLPNIVTNKFEYSTQNSNPINKYAIAIIEVMNRDFEGFRNAGTAGMDIIMPNSETVFSGWIMNMYKKKGVEFFIVNNHTIIPLKKFCDFFNVSAKYRIKRSGSGNVGKSKIDMIVAFLGTNNSRINNIEQNGDKLFVSSLSNLHNYRFIFENNEYMFSKRGNVYEIRKLSNTYNANVIFSITLKPNIGLSDEQFIRYLL